MDFRPGFTVNGVQIVTIGGSLFYNNSKASGIKELDFCDTIVTIGASSCRGMTNLEKVILPANIEVIGNATFMGDSNLKTITPLFPPSLRRLEGVTFCGSGIKGDADFGHLEPDTFSPVNQAWNITQWFLNSKLTSVDLGKSVVTSIVNGCFYQSKLKKVIFPKTLKSLCGASFYSCPLEEVFFKGGPVTVSGWDVINRNSLTMRYVMPHDLGWEEYIDEYCEKTALTLPGDIDTFRQRFPNVRKMPEYKIRLPGNNNFYYLTWWSPSGSTKLMLY